ncbi:unnamed protein product, partial [Effrenium voratum]
VPACGRRPAAHRAGAQGGAAGDADAALREMVAEAAADPSHQGRPAFSLAKYGKERVMGQGVADSANNS